MLTDIHYRWSRLKPPGNNRKHYNGRYFIIYRNMKSNRVTNNFNQGYTIIEIVMVTVLVALLAAFSMQAIIMATGTYTTATKNYLELYQEGKLALEKITREIRDTNPGGIIITADSISFTKQTDHDTPRDSSLSIQFRQVGNTIERQSGAGNHVMVENVATGSFSASQDANNVVTLTFSLAKEDTNIPLRTAVYPRQPE